ncbi:hypothetical protein PGQ11_006050 [Apiospora arundinis]|uniref:Uncharacterized protein n=1 Tax=Apiospora arundinis TaxID=335852 RepID=A0ABR2IRI8_9PEZI
MDFLSPSLTITFNHASPAVAHETRRLDLEFGLVQDVLEGLVARYQQHLLCTLDRYFERVANLEVVVKID